jgi:hypothetical protein
MQVRLYKHRSVKQQTCVCGAEVSTDDDDDGDVMPLAELAC